MKILILMILLQLASCAMIPTMPQNLDSNTYDKIVVGKTTETELVQMVPSLVHFYNINSGVTRRMMKDSFRLCQPHGVKKQIIIYTRGYQYFYINDKTGIVCEKSTIKLK